MWNGLGRALSSGSNDSEASGSSSSSASTTPMAEEKEELWEEGPTETSPLISKSDPDAIETIGRATGYVSSKSKGDPAEGDGETLERQESPEERVGEYEGMPEVKKRMGIIFPAVAIGIFLSAADQTIIVSSYGKIGSEMNALNRTSWIATAYFLTLTSFQPLYGKLSDIFGRKICLLFGYAIFGTGCLFCGLAQDMNQLIAARAFAGIGGGGMTTVVSILLSDVVPLRERGQWQSYINMIFALGASSGAPIGGILADSIGWRWSFLAQAPLCAIAFTCVFFALHLPKRDDSNWRQKLGRIDFLGAAILIGAVFSLLLALDRGSNVSWSAVITIVCLCLSVVFFAAFIFVEIKVAKEPFAPGNIIFHRALFACYLCNFFSLAGWMAANFYIPLYFQAVNGLSATGAGILLIPSISCGVIGSLTGGIYIRKTGRFYWPTVIAYAFLTLGMTGVFLFSGIIMNSTPAILVFMCVNGLANGVAITTNLIALIANAPREDQAVATACSYLFRSLGSVFGVSISATVANSALRNGLASELPKLGLPEGEALDIAEKVRQSLEYLKELSPEVMKVVTECYGRSTSAAFGLQIGLIAGAAVSCWFIKERAIKGR